MTNIWVVSQLGLFALFIMYLNALKFYDDWIVLHTQTKIFR